MNMGPLGGESKILWKTCKFGMQQKLIFTNFLNDIYVLSELFVLHEEILKWYIGIFFMEN